MNKALLRETLDELAPMQVSVPTWESILARAGVEAAEPARRRFRKRVLVIAFAVLVLVLTPLAAIGSQRGWIFTDDDGDVMPGMPKRASDIVVVQTGSWSGHEWEITAYRGTVPDDLPPGPRLVQPGDEVVCFSFQFASEGEYLNGIGQESEAGCAPVPKPSEPAIVDYMTGRDSLPGTVPVPYVIGMAPATVSRVKIRLTNGRTITTPTFAAPEELGAPARFFATPRPVTSKDRQGERPIEEIVGLDAQGQVVANGP